MPARSTLRIPAFELHLGSAATPARVAASAALLDRLIGTSSPNLPEGGITLEIRNYSTKALINSNSRQGKAAAQRVLQFIEDPVMAMRKRKKQASGLARVLLDEETLLVGNNARVIAPNRPSPISLDEPFFDALRGLAQTMSHYLGGETEVYTPVLRVGRVSESDKEKARIILHERAVDVSFHADLRNSLFEVAKHEKIVRTRLECTWVSFDGGPYEYDPKKCTIIEAMPCDLMTGQSFLDAVDDAVKHNGPIFSRDMEDVISESESW